MTTIETASGRAAKPDDLARLSRSRVDPNAARPEPHDETEQEVARRPVEKPADERHDGKHEPVERLLVEKRAPRGSQEDPGHPGNDDDRENRLGARLDIDLVVLP